MRLFIVIVAYFSMSIAFADSVPVDDPGAQLGTVYSKTAPEPYSGRTPAQDVTNFNSMTPAQQDAYIMCVNGGPCPEQAANCKEGEKALLNAEGGSTCMPTADGIRALAKGGVRATTKACDDVLTKTEKMCKGAEFARFSGVATGLASTFAQMKSQGNIKAACEAAQKINSLGAVSNGAVAIMCAKAVSKCKSVCGKDNADVCSEYDQYAQLAGMQAAENATGYVGSSACANAVAGKCTGDEASNDEECVQFCMKPGRQDHPKCKIAINSCGSPTFATANVQYCTCLSNPFAANCSTLTGTDPIPGTGAVPTPPDFSADGLGGAGGYDMDGNPQSPTQAHVNGQSGGGGGFDGGGGGSSAFGANNGSGTGDDPLSKDILTGTGSGGAVGAAYGGGGYNENGSGGGNGKGSASTDSNGIDLRAFLPGGKKDPNRNPASAGYIDPTITKANGLTNFQKVTRKMNEKRPELMP